MDRETALKELRGCHTDDIEVDHINADSILCKLLTSLGYDDVVKEFESITSKLFTLNFEL